MDNTDDMNKRLQWYQQFCQIAKSLTSCKFCDERFNATQVIMLHEIGNLEKGSSLASQVEKYGFSYVLCSKNIGIFLRLGLIKTAENSKDRRKSDLKLTPKGQKVLMQVEPQLSELIKTTQTDVKNTL